MRRLTLLGAENLAISLAIAIARGELQQMLGKRVRQYLIVVGSSIVGVILAVWLAIALLKPARRAGS